MLELLDDPLDKGGVLFASDLLRAARIGPTLYAAPVPLLPYSGDSCSTFVISS